MKERLTVEEFIKRGLLKEGYWFKLHLDPKIDFSLGTEITGFEKEQRIINSKKEYHIFRYTKALNNSDGIKLIGEHSKCKLALRGITGALNGRELIDGICKKYERKGEIEARSITFEEHEKLPSNLKYGRYWIPENCNKVFKNIRLLGFLYWENGLLDKSFLSIDEQEFTRTREVKPVISLHGPKVKIRVGEKNNGEKASTPYEIVIEE